MKTANQFILILFLSIYIPLLACKNSNPVEYDTNRVIIAGNILNSEKYPDDYTIKIIINDFTKSTQRSHVVYLDDNGNFKFDFVKYFPQDIYLKYGKLLYTLFVSPGDSLNIQFDADEFMNPNPENRRIVKSMEFSGDAVQINHDISSFLPHLFEPYSLFKEKEEKYKTLAPADFMSYILSQRDEKLGILEDFINENEPGELFIEWANYKINYECGRDLIRYRWYNPFLNKRKGEKLDLPVEYYNFIDRFQLDNKPASMCSLYKHYLQEYHNYLRDKAKDERPEVIATKNKLQEYKVVLNHLEKNVRGYALEVMLSDEFYTMLDYFNLPDVYEGLYPIYEKNLTQYYFKNTLNEKYTKIKLKEKNPEKSYYYQERNQPVETTKDDIFPSIIEKHKGKVIYIDFWATWCGPCLIEMPFSLKLQNEFKRGELTFVYLCVKSKKDRWETMITDYKIKGDNYLLNDSQYDILSTEFQISGIPHYVLINGKGEIVNKSAQRPSSEEIRSALRELMNE